MFGAPEGFYRRTLDLICEEAHKRYSVDGTISRETVRVILIEHDLKPWQEKMRSIIDLDDILLDVYQRPCNESFPVVCLDEKPVALFADAYARLPPRGPGKIMIKDYEYVRAGSANVFCAVAPKVGRCINKVTNCRDGLELSIIMTDLAA